MDARSFLVKVKNICKEHDSCVRCPIDPCPFDASALVELDVDAFISAVDKVKSTKELAMEMFVNIMTYCSKCEFHYYQTLRCDRCMAEYFTFNHDEPPLYKEEKEKSDEPNYPPPHQVKEVK